MQGHILTVFHPCKNGVFRFHKNERLFNELKCWFQYALISLSGSFISRVFLLSCQQTFERKLWFFVHWKSFILFFSLWYVVGGGGGGREAWLYTLYMIKRKNSFRINNVYHLYWLYYVNGVVKIIKIKNIDYAPYKRSAITQA